MARVIWTPEALGNLDAIGDFLIDHSPSQAADVLSGIVSATRSLTHFPRMGRRIPQARSAELREVLHERLHIVYTVEQDTVRIVAFLHGASDFIARLHAMGLGD